MNRVAGFLAVLAAMLACVWSVQATVIIETVPVGNPGNPADTRYETPGYGAVPYAYNIGKYEVTTGEYCEFLNTVAATDTYGLYNGKMWTDNEGCKIQRHGSAGSYSYSVALDYAHRPVNLVSWGDAARFANWLHNGQPSGTQDLTTTEDGSYFLNGMNTKEELLAITREPDATWVIPSEDEWYKAAYHKNDGVTGNYFDYPTSNDTVPSNALVDDPDPGNNATFGAGDTIGYPYYRTIIGAHENSDSPYGTFDQGGNVFEYNEAVINMRSSDVFGRGFRGGAFSHGDYHLHARNIEEPGTDPTQHRHYVGFRVSEVPEPANIALLALGGVWVLVRRRIIRR